MSFVHFFPVFDAEIVPEKELVTIPKSIDTSLVGFLASIVLKHRQNGLITILPVSTQFAGRHSRRPNKLHLRQPVVLVAVMSSVGMSFPIDFQLVRFAHSVACWRRRVCLLTVGEEQSAETHHALFLHYKCFREKSDSESFRQLNIHFVVVIYIPAMPVA